MQLLLKCASNDKRFVVEEAVRALGVLVDTLSPSRMLPLLLPYAEAHKNPKVRGKAGGALAAAVARMPPADVAAFGHARLLQAAAKLVTGERWGGAAARCSPLQWHACCGRAVGGGPAPALTGCAALPPLAPPLADNTPDARDSAKRVIPLLKVCFSDPSVQATLPSPVKRSTRPAAAAPSSPAKASPSKPGPSPRKPMSPAKGGEEAAASPPPSPWERYCQATLSGSAALAVLKASAD